MMSYCEQRRRSRLLVDCHFTHRRRAPTLRMAASGRRQASSRRPARLCRPFARTRPPRLGNRGRASVCERALRWAANSARRPTRCKKTNKIRDAILGWRWRAIKKANSRPGTQPWLESRFIRQICSLVASTTDARTARKLDYCRDSCLLLLHQPLHPDE